MANLELVVKIPSKAAAIDDCTQRWYFDLADPPATVIGQLISRFYQHDTSGETIGSYLHPAYSRDADACSVEAYDVTAHLDGSPHGSPVAVGTFELAGPATATAMVPTIAAVVDYRSAYGSAVEFGAGTRPRSRLRNRHYWGSLCGSAEDLPSGPLWFPLLRTSFVDVLAGAYTNVFTEFFGAWSTWSRKNAAMAPVTTGWIDSFFHVQRRREDAIGAKLPIGFP